MKDQLKPMNITQALAFCPATTTVMSENDCTLDLFTCAPSSYRAFRQESAVFPGQIRFHLVFLIFLLIGLQHLSLCDHGP